MSIFNKGHQPETKTASSPPNVGTSVQSPKLTDKEIVTYLEYVLYTYAKIADEYNLPYQHFTKNIPAILDLIKRQQAENERLQKLLDDKCDRCIAKERAETLKELMFNLDEEISTYSSNGKGLNVYVWLKNYAKEMAGEG